MTETEPLFRSGVEAETVTPRSPESTMSGMSYLWITPSDLAEDLGQLQDDDVRHLAAELWDLHDDVLPTWMAVEIRDILDVDGIRTAPANLWWGGHDPAGESGRAFQTATGYEDGPYLWPEEKS